MGLVVWIVALGVYAFTAAPALSWLDAAEFSTAAQALAIAHPPGHPIASLLGRLLLYLPLGEAAFRVNLASALAGALAALGVYHAARIASASRLIGAAAALGFAFCGAAWEQAARAEVYALQAALLCAALAWALSYTTSRDARALLAATFATGLALANHHFIAVCFFVPVAIVVLAGRPGVAAAGRLASVGILGLAAYLYLPLRAARDVLGWGDADRLQPFIWTVSAQAFQKSVGNQAPPLLSRLGDVATAVVDNVGLPVTFVALVGVYALARRARGVAFVLAGVTVCVALGRALVGFEPDNPDALGYLLPAIAALFVLGAAGFAALVAMVPRGAVVLAAATLLVPVAQLWRFAESASYRGGEAADTYARLVVAAPPNALVVTSYYETHFLGVAARRLEGERPDVTVVDRNLLTQPYAAAAARRRFPELAAVIDAPLVGGKATPVAALEKLGRPVGFELAPNFDLGDPVLVRITPHGLLAWLDGRGDDDFERVERALTTGSAVDRHGAERILAWEAFVRTRFYCLTGRRAAARAAAARIAPGDEMLVPLRPCLAP